MSRFRLVAILVASHVLAVGAVWFYFNGGHGAAGSASFAGRDQELPGKGRVQVRPAPVPTAPATVTVFRTNQFHWSQVESADYRKYIANLRAVGCPEQTIKDFIITDIMKHFALRRGALKDNGRPFRFWETDDKRALTAKQLAARELELAKIDKEVPSVLRDLLGINYERELSRYFLDTREDDQRLGFLNASKRTQVLTARDLVEEMRERLKQQIGDTPPTPEQIQKLKAIGELHQELVGQSLTPGELEMYLLSTSPTADRLRRELTGFEPTEEEFKRIFKLQRELDDRHAFAAAADPQKLAAQKTLDEQIKQTLGDTRAQELDRARNPGYHDLVLFTQENELPPAAAPAIFEMRTAALQVRAQVLANPELNAEQRAAGLRALQEEVEGTIRATLGKELYGTFTRGVGAWIGSLAKGN